jgi:mycothiol S-conjugate amidase
LNFGAVMRQGEAVRNSPLAMVAVHAHPDDESSKGGATMAKYACEGIRVVVATFTGGERGDVLNPKLAGDAELVANLASVRRAEMAKAAEILGVEQRFLGFVDSGYPDGDPPPPPPAGSFAATAIEVAAVPLVELIREIRPQVLTTYDPTGGYPHPDHIQTHRVSIRALELAASEPFRPELGPPHAVAKVYFDQSLSFSRIQAVHKAMLARGIDSPYRAWLEEHADRRSKMRPTTTRVQVADYFQLRDSALRAHATQVDPDGWFFAMPREIERQVWPYEDFELAASSVAVQLPEADLFAGLR